MVDSVRPNLRPVPVVTPTEAVKPSAGVATHNDDKAGEDYVVTVDRRKGRDRRKGKDGKRAVYDMRRGRGRRKDDFSDGVEVRV